MAEMADAEDLKSSDENHVGSIPTARTIEFENGSKIMYNPIGIDEGKYIGSEIHFIIIDIEPNEL